MKPIQLLMFLMLAGSLLAPELRAEEIEFEVHGMACSFCAYGLEKKVKKMDGVQDLSINVQTGRATLTTEPGTAITIEELQKVASDSGLKIREASGLAESNDASKKCPCGHDHAEGQCKKCEHCQKHGEDAKDCECKHAHKDGKQCSGCDHHKKHKD